MLLIGSRALPTLFKRHTNSDWDFIAPFEEVAKLCAPLRIGASKGHLLGAYKRRIADIELTEENDPLYEAILGDFWTRKDEDYYIPSLNVLYMLKMSCRFRKNWPHFKKNMNDIHIMRKAGVYIPEWLMPHYKERMRKTYAYQVPNLNRSKKDFFVDDFYVYDHDSVHKAVAIGREPAYLSYKLPGKEVLCSQKMFQDAPLQVRLNGVMEEAAVLALERSLIPNGWVDDDYRASQAYTIALEKVCTSITSGWFREFAWENYHSCFYLNYHKVFKERIHLLRPFEK